MIFPELASHRGPRASLPIRDKSVATSLKAKLHGEEREELAEIED